MVLATRVERVRQHDGTVTSPFEVEEALRRHRDVLFVVAFPIPHGELREAIGVAVVPTNARRHITLRALCESAARGGLPPCRLPTAFILARDDGVMLQASVGSPIRRTTLARRLNIPELSKDEIRNSWELNAARSLVPLHRFGHDGAPVDSQTSRVHELHSLVSCAVDELAAQPIETLDQSLMEAGITSLLATRFADRLSERLGTHVSSTLVFEHSTPRAVVSHLVLCEEEEAARRSGAPARGSVLRRRRCSPHPAHDAPLTIVGPALRWPSACMSAAALNALLASSGDSVSTVPSARWSDADVACELGLGPAAGLVAEATSGQAAQAAEATSAVGSGSFVLGAERFDHFAFGLAPAECRAMDPQQRLLLEVGYHSLHADGWRRAALQGRDVAFFIGVERSEWPFLHARAPTASLSIFAATADTASVAGGRVSFLLGLHGACVSIDTACSASIVAAHGAAFELLDARCESALVGTVKLLLHCRQSILFARAGMLSPDGRCKTFDARANGYARAEGVGAATLRLVRPHGAEEAGEAQWRLLTTAVKQDGRSASLTAPNGSAQRVLLLEAILRCEGPLQNGTLKDALSAVETHGTGTPLGDPTEMAGLTSALVAASIEGTVAVGAAKSHVGHTEPAAGMLGLQKAMVHLRSGRMDGFGHLRVLNPLARGSAQQLKRPLQLPLQPLALRKTAPVITAPVIIGVSSFGYSGTIAHAVWGRVRSAAPAIEPHTLLPLVVSELRYRRVPFRWAAPQLDAQDDSSVLATCRLGRRSLSVDVLHAFRQLPADEPALVEVVGLHLPADDGLSACVAARHAPYILLAHGRLSGVGMLTLLNWAMFVVADSKCSIRASPEQCRECFDRRKLRAAATGTSSDDGRALRGMDATALYTADEAFERGWFDAVASSRRAAKADAQKMAARLKSVALTSASNLVNCYRMLPAPTVDAALVTMGTLFTCRPRASIASEPRRVRLYADEPARVAILELHDPGRSNTFTRELCEDLLQAVDRLRARIERFDALVVRGAGPHFCAGGSTFMHRTDGRSWASLPLPASSFLCRHHVYEGFIQLFALDLPVTCAVHGMLKGGAIAICLNSVYTVADHVRTRPSMARFFFGLPSPNSLTLLPHAISRARNTPSAQPCRRPPLSTATLCAAFVQSACSLERSPSSAAVRVRFTFIYATKVRCRPRIPSALRHHGSERHHSSSLTFAAPLGAT